MTGKLTEKDKEDIADKVVMKIHPTGECRLFNEKEVKGLKMLASMAESGKRGVMAFATTILIVGFFVLLCVGAWEWIKKFPFFNK